MTVPVRKFIGEYICETLREVLRVCTLETSHFGMDKEKSDEVKKAIRIWLETWIEEPCRRSVAVLEHELKGEDRIPSRWSLEHRAFDLSDALQAKREK